MINKKILAVILGGGQGSRLKPLTQERSKPAVPVAGKYRLADIPISNCINCNINRVFVLTQFNSASLNNHIKNTYSLGLFSDGFVDILAAEQTNETNDWYQGTADAIRKNFVHFKTYDYEYLLILSGDQLYHMDFEDMMKNHIEKNAVLSIATIPVTAEDATSFGIMKTNESKKIVSFVEKPDKEELKNWMSDTGEEMRRVGKNYLASMGIYLFNKESIKEMLFNNKGSDFGKNIIPGAIDKYNVVSYQHNGYWEDIGTIKSFHKTNLELTRDIPPFNLYDAKAPVYTRARTLPPAKIENTQLSKVVVSEGAIIRGSSISKSVIGIRTRIEEGTTIKDSYIMGGDYYETLEELAKSRKNNVPVIGIGENCNITNAIVDKNARIGNNVIINGGPHLNDDETDTYKIIDGIVVVKKNAIIPDGFTLS